MNRSDDYIMGGPSGSPNEPWKHVFDEASEAPPPRVWDAVERQLDLDDEDGIIPLWQHRQGQQSMLFGRWAAGIAASLLLTLFGWWTWHRGAGIQPVQPTAGEVASVRAAEKAKPAAPLVQSVPTARPTDNDAPKLERTDRALAKTYPAKKPAQQPVPTRITAPLPDAPLVAAAPMMSQAAQDELLRVGEHVVFTQRLTTNTPDGQLTLSMTTRQSVSVGAAGRSGFAPAQTLLTSAPLMASRPALAPVQPDVPGLLPPAPIVAGNMDANASAAGLAPLSIRPMTIRAAGNDRIVWYRADAATDASLAEATQTKARSRRRQAWVSTGLSAAAFDPAVALRSAVGTVAAAPSSYVSSTPLMPAPQINSLTGMARSVQINAGLPLGEHWAIETGVGYLSGQSSVQSPGRSSSYGSVANDKQMNIGTAAPNLYTEAISRSKNTALASASQAGQSADFLNNSSPARYESAAQTVSNAYQFVQVPAQVSYEFRPRRKLGLALLTGLVSNWFVRNTVGQTVDVKPGDGVYRPVTMAGTAGVRLRYRPDNHWSASMAGSFQQNLQSLTLNDVSVQALPQQVGVSLSVDRHF